MGLLKLALPVVLTYLGFMSMALVDLVFVGRVSPVAIGAVGLGSSVFSWFMIFGIGLLTGMDFLVSHARGRGDLGEARVIWVQGLWLSVLLGIPLSLVLFFLAGHLEWFGVAAEVRAPAASYLKILSFSLVPVYLFTACRLYLQALEIVRPALWILVIANLINAAINYALVLGNWGAPRMEADGSAWATSSARLFMLVAVGVVVLRRKTERQGGFKFALGPLKRLLRLGIPSALQMSFEVGVFALSTTLAAGLDPVSLAAHQIALNIASFTFMVPLGIGAATSVVVGNALGRSAPREAVQQGWRGLSFGIGFMALSCLVLLIWGKPILAFYSPDPQVLSAALSILTVVALFQLSDGAQTVATGALRGLADTQSAMLANLIGHWAIGLPIGVALCYWMKWGLRGLWIGLSLGLTVVAIALVWRWTRRARITCS